MDLWSRARFERNIIEQLSNFTDLILNESKKLIKRNVNSKAKFDKRVVRFMKLFFVLHDIFYVRFGVAALNQENCL